MMIYLTYAPTHPKFEKDRICGHTFEVMDYYLFLKDLGYEVKIKILDVINPKKIFKAWEDKYILSKNYQNDIIFEKYKGHD